MPLSWKRNKSAEERFDLSVIKSNDCWIWLGRLNGDGYANIRVHGKTIGAHRFSYERFVGPIPSGMQLDHLCKNRGCTNPRHLELVTNLENWERGDAPSRENKYKTNCKYGHILSEDNLIIRKNGYRQCRLCNREQAKRWRDNMESLGAPRDSKGRIRGMRGEDYKPLFEA